MYPFVTGASPVQDGGLLSTELLATIDTSYLSA
jgi:hypothetical protein